MTVVSRHQTKHQPSLDATFDSENRHVGPVTSPQVLELISEQLARLCRIIGGRQNSGEAQEGKKCEVDRLGLTISNWVSVRRSVHIPILPLIIYRYSAVGNHNLEFDDSWTDPVLSERQYEDRLLLHMESIGRVDLIVINNLSWDEMMMYYVRDWAQAGGCSAFTLNDLVSIDPTSRRRIMQSSLASLGRRLPGSGPAFGHRSPWCAAHSESRQL